MRDYIFQMMCLGVYRSSSDDIIYKSQSQTQLEMNRCQHGQKITKFCITQHCHNKQAGGCDYCIKKYHFHLTNTLLLNESDLQQTIRRVTTKPEIKFKSRSYQQYVGQYLRSFKTQFNNWIDSSLNNLSDRLSYPALKKNGMLPTYNRIKNRQYKKISGKELRFLYDYGRNKKIDQLELEDQQIYFWQIDHLQKFVGMAQRILEEIKKITGNNDPQAQFQDIDKSKVSQVYQTIQKERAKRLQFKKKEETLTNAPVVAANTSYVGSGMGYLEFIKKIGGDGKERREEVKRQEERERAGDKSSRNQKIDSGLRKTVPSDLRAQVKRKDSVKLQIAALLQDDRSDDRKLSLQSKKEERPQNIETARDQSATSKAANQESKRLRRRRSSIDNYLGDLKFGEKGREIEERNRKLQEAVPLESDSKQRTQASQQDNRSKNESSESQRKSQKSSQKNLFAQLKGLNLPDMVVNHVLPQPPSTRKYDPSETVMNKIIKIPFAHNHYQEQIQSPIFKHKKKEQNKANTFSIGLNVVAASTSEPQSAPPTVQTNTPTKPEKYGGEGKGKQDKIEDSTPKKPAQIIKLSPVIPKLDVSLPKAPPDELIVLQLNEKNSLLLFSQALKSDPERAITLLRASLKYSPNNISAAEYLSYLFLEVNKPKECLEVCESILQQIEDKPEQFDMTVHIHNNKAAALNMLGRYSQSIYILEKCLRYRRKDYFYKNLADAYFSLAIYEKAVMYYEKALKLNDEYDEVLYNLAVCQFIQEQYSSCMLNVLRAVKVAPQNEEYRELLVEVKKRLDNLLK